MKMTPLSPSTSLAAFRQQLTPSSAHSSFRVAYEFSAFSEKEKKKKEGENKLSATKMAKQKDKTINNYGMNTKAIRATAITMKKTEEKSPTKFEENAQER